MSKIPKNSSLPSVNLYINSPQSVDRNCIIHISTQIETTISTLLRLAIGDYENNSLSFGSSSSALSLSTKINLLIDFNVFTNSEKSDFIKFMEIRNKFAHNFNVNSLEDLLKEPKSDILKFLTKRFKNNIQYKELRREDIWNLYYLLVDSIHTSLVKFHIFIENRAGEFGKIDYRNNFYEAFHEVTSDMAFLKSIDGNSTQITTSLLAEINRRVSLKTKKPDDILSSMKGKSLF